jgi:hypothetical protein
MNLENGTSTKTNKKGKKLTRQQQKIQRLERDAHPPEPFLESKNACVACYMMFRFKIQKKI